MNPSNTIIRAAKRYGWIVVSLVLMSCQRDVVRVSQNTLLMYFPWSSNLQPFFSTNISDMASAIEARGGLNDQRVMVYLAVSVDSAVLYDVQYDASAKVCRLQLCRTYGDVDYREAEHLTTVLTEVKQYAPATHYAMSIGSHGLGWIPVAEFEARRSNMLPPRLPYGANAPITRLYGDINGYAMTDITTLADAMQRADFHTRYILFDCCCMANVEVVYDLKRVTDYVIASVSEILGVGMPYRTMGNAMLDEPDYDAMCQAYLTHCLNLSYPCGTLAVIKTEWIDSLARLTGQLTKQYPPISDIDSMQVYDGYNPHVFYDYGDYMRHANLSPSDSLTLDDALRHLVPSAVHTPTYLSARDMQMYPIRHYSGLTISAPSTHPCCRNYHNTAWYQACQTP